jgi:hypothetical protein
VAENTRVRIEPHIESYLKSHGERILDKAATEKFTVAEMGIITNALLLEHKQAHKMLGAIAQKIPLANFFTWLTNLGSGNGKVIQMTPETPALSSAKEDLDFTADFANQFEDVA